jgi:hypothetical protein
MKIVRIDGISLDELYRRDIDLVVVASGYESRARALAGDIMALPRGDLITKWAWGFEEFMDNPVRKHNDALLSKMGYSTRIISGGDGASPEDLIADYIACHDLGPLSLVVDISSMTRTWYGGIVKALSRVEHAFPVSTIFGYSPAVWSRPPKEVPPNEVLGPVPGFAAHVLPSKPAALVIGLGREPDRALGLKDYLDPRTTVCFYANPGAARQYERAAMAANEDLLRMIPANQLYQYDLLDPVGSLRILASVCQGLARDYRVVLASLGPKVFGLFCFLIHVHLPEISVWRVSPATRQTPFDHKSRKMRIFLDVVWA